MAPLRPLPNRHEAPPKSILKGSNNIPVSKQPRSESLFTTSKKDKRRIKHAQLISKVTKPTISKVRRRRPNKKLVTTLDALANALPDDGEGDPEANAGSTAIDQVNVIKRKSMKSRPGAMKRKQKLDNNERDRFARNLAQMAVPLADSSAVMNASTSGDAAAKLRALRGFISQTLEKRPGVVDAKG